MACPAYEPKTEIGYGQPESLDEALTPDSLSSFGGHNVNADKSQFGRLWRVTEYQGDSTLEAVVSSKAYVHDLRSRCTATSTVKCRM